MPGSRRLLSSRSRMAERRKHRVSAGQDARSERPAMGVGSPERLEPDSHRLKTCATGGTHVENLCYGTRAAGKVISP